MESRYRTLQTLYTLVKDKPQPTQYQCIPRQMVLFLPYDWAAIYSHLVLLEKEGLVQIGKADNIQFSITEKGVIKTSLLETITKEAVARK